MALMKKGLIVVGKNTCLHGQHETRQASMVSRVELSDDEWKSIDAIILENKIRFELSSKKYDLSQIQKLIPVIYDSRSLDKINDLKLSIKLLMVKAYILRYGGNQITEDIKCFINKQYKLSNKEWHVIETDLSKKSIDDKLRNEINDRLSMIAHYRKEYFYKNVNLQDIKRSLRAIKKLSPVEATEAYKNIDASSVAYIDAEIWKKKRLLPEAIFNEEYFEFTEAGFLDINQIAFKRLSNLILTGKAIIEAAEIALKELPRSAGGKPLQSHNDDIAKLAQEIWDRLGCHGKAYATEDEGSDLTRFAGILFETVNGFSNASSISKIIRKINK